MKKKIKKKYSFIALAIEMFILAAMVMAFNLPVLAKDETEEKVYEEEYVVTATRIPQSLGEVPGMIEMISGEEADKGIETVSEVLAENGFSFSSYGGEHSTACLQMDGVNDSRLQFMVNGVSMSPNATGNVDLSFFPTAGLKRIEVVHGPLSALYGANALGGVVNIITDLTGEPEKTLSLNGGSFSTKQWGLAMKQKRWGIAWGGNATDGFRDYSASERYYFSGQYNFFQTDSEYLIFRGDYMGKNSQQPGSVHYPAKDDQYDQRLMCDLSGRMNWIDGLWEYKIYGQEYKTEYKSGSETTKDKHKVMNYGVDIAALYEVANHELLVGSTFETDHVESTTSGKHSLDNFSLYFQDLWFISADLMLLSGLRWDYNSEYGSPFSPRISVTKYFSDELNISFAYGQAFTAPTISDLYDVYESAWYSFYGNPDLKPEKSERFDLTGNWRSGRDSFLINIYRSTINDGIAYTDNFQSKTNIAQIIINGLNLKIERALTTNIFGSLGYRWVERMEDERKTQTFLPSTTYDYGDHRWDLALKYKKDGLTSTLSGQIVSGRRKLPNYQLWHFSLNYQVNQVLSLSLAANNLLGEEYEIISGYPMPGRSFSAGLSYSF